MSAEKTEELAEKLAAIVKILTEHWDSKRENRPPEESGIVSAGYFFDDVMTLHHGTAEQRLRMELRNLKRDPIEYTLKQKTRLIGKQADEIGGISVMSLVERRTREILTARGETEMDPIKG